MATRNHSKTPAASPRQPQFAPGALEPLEKFAKRLVRVIKHAREYRTHPDVVRGIVDDFYAAIHTAPTQ